MKYIIAFGSLFIGSVMSQDHHDYYQYKDSDNIPQYLFAVSPQINDACEKYDVNKLNEVFEIYIDHDIEYLRSNIWYISDISRSLAIFVHNNVVKTYDESLSEEEEEDYQEESDLEDIEFVSLRAEQIKIMDILLSRGADIRRFGFPIGILFNISVRENKAMRDYFISKFPEIINEIVVE